jgi:hypothetical protein
MPGNNLTMNSQIQCPHAGQAVLFTSNTKVFADGALCLLESDIHPVAGCPFTLPGGKYSPCVRIEWSAGATKVSAAGQPVLVQSSIGKCMSPEGAPQGVAIIVNTQMKASST